MKNRILAAVLTLGLAVAAFVTSPVYAGSTTAQSQVEITYTGSCDISASHASFSYTGEQDEHGRAYIDIKCSFGLPWTLLAGLGNYSDATRRNAANSQGGPNVVYRLYNEIDLNTEIGLVDNTIATGTGDGNYQRTTGFMLVKRDDNAGVALKPGTFTDTIQWTLNF